MKPRFSRQSFLGLDGQRRIEECTVGVIGLGGGGSHIAQQLAHIGFKNYVLLDPDLFKDVNLNRTVGAMDQDIDPATPKIEIASRLILGIVPEAHINAFRTPWQENLGALSNCDLVFGCVDGFGTRRDLEAYLRRLLIPYIDIGMDVYQPDKSRPAQIVGQVILSMPGCPCMHCIGFLTEEKLAREASAYGDAGPMPQVVWANGVLASTAVGMGVDLLTGWTGSMPENFFLSYRGNSFQLVPDNRLQILEANHKCKHFPS